MRIEKSGIVHIANMIAEDLEDRETALSKPQRVGLADLASSVLSCRSVNTSEIASVLPRAVKDDESRFRYIFRWLSNDKIKIMNVMKGFIPEILELVTAQGQTAILMLDQSKISDGFECLMVSLRLKERALPVIWQVVETKGPIGIEIQEPLLRQLRELIPNTVNVLLMADRFYGTSALIKLCQELGFAYRVRLKDNLILSHEDGEITPRAAIELGLKSLEKVTFNNTDVQTNIGIVQEPGHPEPWIIAMDVKPTPGRVLDYGMRWGIEAMFSDLKTRGFNITHTQLKKASRIERLILVLSIAMMWAVSTGLTPKPPSQPSKKKSRDRSPHALKKDFVLSGMPL